MLSRCEKIVYKCKWKLCGFPEEKTSSRRKLFIHEFQWSDPQKDKVDPWIAICGSLIWTLMYIDYGGGLHYDTWASIVILLAERILGENLHDFSIKSIYKTTTLICFKDIWKINLLYNIQIHKFYESSNSLYYYFKLVQWQCHIFIEASTSFWMLSLEFCNFTTLERKYFFNGLLVFNLLCFKLP